MNDLLSKAQVTTAQRKSVEDQNDLLFLRRVHLKTVHRKKRKKILPTAKNQFLRTTRYDADLINGNVFPMSSTFIRPIFHFRITKRKRSLNKRELLSTKKEKC